MIKKFIALLMVCIMMTFTVPASAEEPENLAAGLSYTIETGEPVTMSHANFTEGGGKFDVDDGQLTDGVMGKNSSSSKTWYKAFRGQSRIVTFDLGSVCAIQSVKAGFFHQSIAGIYAPRYINVSLSDDGESYGTVAEHQTGIDLSATPAGKIDVEVPLDKTYAARYVRVEFCSDIFTFCDEIFIYGSKTADGTEAKAEPDKETEPKGYLTELKGVSGVSDIAKLYNGYYAPDVNVGILNEKELLPYVAYLDTSENIAGTMFDAIAFVPCHGDYPSGGRLVKTHGKAGAVMSDWELYFEYTFKEGQDLDALDNVVGDVYGTLGKEGKYKVFLTVPYPTVLTNKLFGVINGEENYCKTIEERTAIVKWFMDKCISKFEEMQYENLELAGFYWLREEINYSDSSNEADLAKFFTSYADSNNLATIFDPFYLSIGFDHWENLGFSGAVMQPNVAFSESYPYFEIGMLGEFAQSVYNNNLGVEIETNEPSFFRGEDYAKAGYNYESYLYYGAKTGYMDCVKTYYQGANPGSIYDFCHADTSTPRGVYLRRLYDITHSFIQGTYKNEAPTVEAKDIELVLGDARGMSEIIISDNDSYWGDINIEFPTEPQHGDVAAAASKKTLIYRPDEGFVGEDTFTLRVSDGFNVSEEITVRVTVTEPDVSQNGESEVSAESSETEPTTEGGMPAWLIALIAVFGALAVIAVVVFILKGKK